MEKSKLSSRFATKSIQENSENISTENKISAKELFAKSVQKKSTPQIPDKCKVEELDIDILLEKINSTPCWFDFSTEKQKELIESFVLKKSPDYKDIELLFTQITRFAPINSLLENDNVDSVIINDVKSVFIEIQGKVLNTEMKLSRHQLKFILNYIEHLYKEKISDNIVNYSDDEFIISVFPPKISCGEYVITVRKNKNFTFESLIDEGFISKEVLEFVISVLNMRKNVVISGDINSGKSTFINVLLSSVLKDRRCVLFQNTNTISQESDMWMKFDFDNNDILVSNILKMMPEYIVGDFNNPLIQFSDNKGLICSINSSSVDGAISKLIETVADNISEKMAKSKVLQNYDYIIQLNRTQDGVKVTSVVELTLAKTMAASVKTIAQYSGGSYITQIVQPLTSLRAAETGF